MTDPTDKLLQQKLDHVTDIESLEAFLIFMNGMRDEGALTVPEQNRLAR